MNTQNQENNPDNNPSTAVATTRKSTRKLDSLTQEQQTYVLEIASNARLIDIVQALKEIRIDVSISTIHRFLKCHRENELLQDGDAMQPALNALAKRGETGTLRKGTMEAVRQRLYDRVLTSNDPAEALALYNSMLKEESKLRELEIQARKVTAFEEQVRIQAMKLILPGAVRPSTVVKSTAVEPTAIPASSVTQREQALEQLLHNVTSTLNGPGAPEQKVVTARAQLTQEPEVLKRST